jgi:transcriptional regulator with XRE-family HTH domain
MNRKHPLPLRMSREFDLLGKRIKLARLRRKYTMEQVSERAGIDIDTLLSVERGGCDIEIWAYAVVLRVLGLEQDLYRIAEDDTLGRKLQDIELLNQ